MIRHCAVSRIARYPQSGQLRRLRASCIYSMLHCRLYFFHAALSHAWVNTHLLLRPSDGRQADGIQGGRMYLLLCFSYSDGLAVQLHGFLIPGGGSHHASGNTSSSQGLHHQQHGQCGETGVEVTDAFEYNLSATSSWKTII